MKALDYHEFLIKELKDPNLAAEYLTASFEEGDKDLFLQALRNVVEALGGITRSSNKTKLGRTNMYKMLSKGGNPTISSLSLILKNTGIGISFYQKKV